MAEAYSGAPEPNKITVLTGKNSIAQQFLTELRDKTIQQDRLRFNRNLERLGNIMAYEISKEMAYKQVNTVTPLKEALTHVLTEQPVIAGVLRAALPLQSGLADFFDGADQAFVSAYRKYIDENTFEVVVEYMATPSLDDRVLIFADPMLATGKSIALALNALMTKGKPAHIHVVSVVASRQGLNYLDERFKGVSFWIGAIDEELNPHGYIVPGLGDAGDLSFGLKL